MDQIDEIIEKVVKRIQEQSQQATTILFHYDEMPPENKVFNRSKSINIDHITINFILDLYQVNQNSDWVNWILNGISNDVHFYFEISKNIINFIPKKMLLDWPVDFVIGSDSLVWSTHSLIINRSELAKVPDKSYLVLNPKQSFTEEARDLIGLKQLVICERTEEDCIWQK